MKKERVNLVTVKVTEKAADNFRLAAALGKKTQYEVSEEGSQFVLGKYRSKPAIERIPKKIKSSSKKAK